MSDTTTELPQDGPTPATQVVHPWRTVARTALQWLIAAATVYPLVVAQLGDMPAQLATLLAGGGVVAAAITRIMAIPEVNALLAKIGLGAQPKAETELAAATGSSWAGLASRVQGLSLMQSPLGGVPKVGDAELVTDDDRGVLVEDPDSPPYEDPVLLVGHDPEPGGAAEPGRHSADRDA